MPIIKDVLLHIGPSHCFPLFLELCNRAFPSNKILVIDTLCCSLDFSADRLRFENTGQNCMATKDECPAEGFFRPVDQISYHSKHGSNISFQIKRPVHQDAQELFQTPRIECIGLSCSYRLPLALEESSIYPWTLPLLSCSCGRT